MHTKSEFEAKFKKNSRNYERIAKRIATLGYCSRREAERLILEKKVKVNNVFITTPAFFVSNNDVISVENNELKNKVASTKLYAYYKPCGLVCSNNDEKGRPTIFDDLSKFQDLPRLISVGRLDLTSEGLLLLTNSGDLSKTLSAPQNNFVRVYKVRAFGSISQNELEKLSLGVTIDEVKYKSIIANLLKSSGKNIWLEFRITEGKNREIRKICDYLGLQVNRLIRTHFGPYSLGDLKEGEIVEVDVSKLYKHHKQQKL